VRLDEGFCAALDYHHKVRESHVAMVVVLFPPSEKFCCSPSAGNMRLHGELRSAP
jgi:hypothetical protein